MKLMSICFFALLSLSPQLWAEKYTDSTYDSWYDYRLNSDHYYLRINDDWTLRPYPLPAMPQSMEQAGSMVLNLAAYVYLIWPVEWLMARHLFSPLMVHLPRTHVIMTMIILDVLRNQTVNLMYSMAEVLFDQQAGCTNVHLQEALLSRLLKVRVCMPENSEQAVVIIERAAQSFGVNKPSDSKWAPWYSLLEAWEDYETTSLVIGSNGKNINVNQISPEDFPGCRVDIDYGESGKPLQVLENELHHTTVLSGEEHFSLLDSAVIEKISECIATTYSSQTMRSADLAAGSVSVGKSLLIHFDTNDKAGRTFDDREGLWLTWNPGLNTKQGLPYTMSLGSAPDHQIGADLLKGALSMNKADLLAGTLEYIPYVLLMGLTSQGYSTTLFSSPGKMKMSNDFEVAIPRQYAETAHVVRSTMVKIFRNSRPVIWQFFLNEQEKKRLIETPVLRSHISVSSIDPDYLERKLAYLIENKNWGDLDKLFIWSPSDNLLILTKSPMSGGGSYWQMILNTDPEEGYKILADVITHTALFLPSYRDMWKTGNVPDFLYGLLKDMSDEQLAEFWYYENAYYSEMVYLLSKQGRFKSVLKHMSEDDRLPFLRGVLKEEDADRQPRFFAAEAIRSTLSEQDARTLVKMELEILSDKDALAPVAKNREILSDRDYTNYEKSTRVLKGFKSELVSNVLISFVDTSKAMLAYTRLQEGEFKKQVRAVLLAKKSEIVPPYDLPEHNTGTVFAQ